ncbi:hypothetical protein [Limobrevibacterium gyesilva]|uniref:Uncharacterized protein n=1 Tax=Limobrevibacterium gyesilva TaxID=2991712 RepID=A0AA41YLR5_9PROT|nr:hypothetical protein [Limobrevibacterium gyesilva]MCW3476181.1 hypothetical protein [Limobrevibacterium gyesilva]
MIRQSAFIYEIATLIALASSLGAVWLPARKAARTDPLSIIRSAT